MLAIVIPWTRLAASDDEALRKKREEIRRRLLEGERLVVGQNGDIRTPAEDARDQRDQRPGIRVPEGKLASFYWYDNDPELYRSELDAMRQFFPCFRLHKEADGRLSWVGQVTPGMLEVGRRTYTLQLVYGHDHPSNDSYGGSIKVYSIDPDIEAVADGESIPHTLRDSCNALYLCTARKEDVHTSAERTTSAASALAWAVKWIACFELWLEGRITRAQFADHKI